MRALLLSLSAVFFFCLLNAQTEPDSLVSFLKNTHQSGIYFFDKNDANEPLKRVLGSEVILVNVGMLVRTSMSKTKVTAKLYEPTARIQIDDLKPVFYFYFDHQFSSVDEEPWYTTPTRPEKFKLVQLYVKEDRRFFNLTYQTKLIASITEPGSGVIDMEDLITFRSIKIAEGIYRVEFSRPLDPDEYCFVFTGEEFDEAEEQVVFDFGIQKGGGTQYIKSESKWERSPKSRQ